MERFTVMRRVAGALGKATLAAALVGSFAFGSVQAMGKGHSSGSGDCSTPTLAGPASASWNESFSIDGCGFQPGAVVPLIGAEANGCCFTVNMVADSTGRFSWQGLVWGVGDYSYKALQQSKSGWRTVATWSFDTH